MKTITKSFNLLQRWTALVLFSVAPLLMLAQEQNYDRTIDRMTFMGQDFEFKFIPMDTTAVREAETYTAYDVRGFYILTTELTVAQWQIAIPMPVAEVANCKNCPVTDISVADIEAYCTNFEVLFGHKLQLPDASQWLRAARCLNDNAKPMRFSGSDNVNFVARYAANSNGKLSIGATKLPNCNDIFDLSGNAAELVKLDNGYTFVGGSFDSPSAECIIPASVEQLKANTTIIDRYYHRPNIGFRPIYEVERSITVDK